MNNVVTGLALAACVFAVSGCGCGDKKPITTTFVEKMMEKAIEKDGGGKASVDLKDNKFTIKTEKGEVSYAAGEGTALPKDFPADVYVEKAAKVQAVINAGTGISVTMMSKATVAEASEVYQKEMTANGWKQDTQMTMQEQIYTAFKKENRQTLVTIAKTDEGTLVTLMLTKEGGE